MKTRLDLEKREMATLSAFATKAANSKGRVIYEDEDDLRTAFQRDRDRILHCKAFRRLSHKTQVFIGAQGDHYRTRLTHTLEVAQISRTIARVLALNEDLTEAIALGHDLGHTPFGHTGENALQAVILEYNNSHPDDKRKVFKHNEQSLRVVDLIEKDGKGLNLTAEVRDGIAHHTGSTKAFTLEGQIVATADRIAYINHDIDDAIRAGIISQDDLPQNANAALGQTHSERISAMVSAMIEASDGKSSISMTGEVQNAMNVLREFLFENVYTKSPAKEEGPKAENLVKMLFAYYIKHTDEVPFEYRKISQGDNLSAVVDYIAGMTDRYARSTFEEIYIPKNWQG